MKKNAFTLIELLAVIVILAIIALIATPIILGIINDSKEQSTKRSAENYIDAVEQAIVRKNLEGEYNPKECKIENGEVTCKGKFSPKYCEIIDGQLNCDGVSLEVEIDGEIPTGGTIVFQNGKAISGTKLTFKGYETSINDKGEIVLEKTGIQKTYKKYDDGDVVYFDIKEGKSCTNYHEDNSKTGYNGIYEGDNSTKTTDNQNNCLKFYAFLDDGGEKLNLLLDHNTTATIEWINKTDFDNAGGIVTDDLKNHSGCKYGNLCVGNNVGPITLLKKLYEDTKDWDSVITPSNYTMNQSTQTSQAKYTIEYSKTPSYEGATTTYKARLITAQEIARITGADKETTLNFKEESSTEWYNLDGAKTNDTVPNWQTSVSDSLNKSEYYWLFDRTNDCTSYGCEVDDTSNYGYWTSSANAGYSSTAWRVYSRGSVSNCDVFDTTNSGGIRPVITILKSNI